MIKNDKQEIKALFLSALLLVSISACHNTSNPEKDYKVITEKPHTETLKGENLVRKLLNAQHIYPMYITASGQLKDEYVYLYGESAEKKAPENLYFYSDTAVRIFAGKLKLIKDQEIQMLTKNLVLTADWTYCKIDSNIEIASIADKNYLYFSHSTSNMGNAVREKSIGFELIDLTTLLHQSLNFQGVSSQKCDDCLEGGFTNENSFRKVPKLLFFLKQKADKDPGIYHPAKRDKDWYAVINYQTKWDKDNNADNHWANGHGTIEIPIKVTYYPTNLFTMQKGSDFGTAENEQYLFKSYFSGSVIGYDKIKKLYFPLVVEDCASGCSKNISVSAEMITISYDDKEVYKIPFSSISFDPHTGQ